MSPIGPFKSNWCVSDFYILSDWDAIEKKVIYVTVPNGTPRSEGLKHPTLRDAKKWMEDNGFELKGRKT